MRVQLALHPKQSQVFQSPARQILFGGAAGPGKSHLLRIAAIAWAYAIPGLQVYLFRRTFPDLYKNHMEGPASFPMLLAPWMAEGFVKINYAQHQITFAHHAKIHLAHMQYEHDTDKIQGAEIHVALLDELTHFTKTQYSFIRSRVRMAGLAIPPALEGRFPRILAASNPGGPGHGWVRALFVDSAPPGQIWEAPVEEGGLTTQFIPALLRDNPTLLREDPTYADRLRGLSSPELVRAMLEGDWNAMVGGMLDDVWDPSIHVLEPAEIPQGWRIRRALDWGSSHPFSVGWWAHSDGATPFGPQARVYRKGTRFRIHELYGWNGKVNTGLRMTNTEIARWIKDIEASVPWGSRVEAGPADSQIYDVVNGTSIAHEMASQGISFKPAQKGPGSRRQGWQVLRQLLKASLQWPMEEPGLFVFNTCRQFIRTVPVLPRDPSDSDDADSDSEDHCFAGETLIETPAGPYPIAELVGRQGTVLTDLGPQHFTQCRLTRKQADVVLVTFSNGRRVSCTPDHLFLTHDKRWVKAQDLIDETCYNVSLTKEDTCRLSLLAQRFKNLMVNASISVATIFNTMARGCIVPSGRIITALYRQVLTCIIAPMTEHATSLKTLNYCLNISMDNSMLSNETWENKEKHGWLLLARQRRSGMGRKKAESGMRHTITSVVRQHCFNGKRWYVDSVEPHLKRQIRAISILSAQIDAKRRSAGQAGLMMLRKFARYVGQGMSATNILNKPPVAPRVARLFVVSVRPAGKTDVYCLTVPDVERFAIEGGIIVHNCADETRYECTMPLPGKAGMRALRF